MHSQPCILGSRTVVINYWVPGQQHAEAQQQCPVTRQEAPRLALGQCSGSLQFILGPGTEFILQC